MCTDVCQTSMRINLNTDRNPVNQAVIECVITPHCCDCYTPHCINPACVLQELNTLYMYSESSLKAHTLAQINKHGVTTVMVNVAMYLEQQGNGFQLRDLSNTIMAVSCRQHLSCKSQEATSYPP